MKHLKESENMLPSNPLDLLDHSDLSLLYFYIGKVHHTLGNYNEALNYHNLSLDNRKKHLIKNDYRIGYSINDIGLVYYSQGEYEKALEFFNQALEIHKKNGNKSVIAETNNNIGNVYHEQGDYNKALEYQNRSLEMIDQDQSSNQLRRAAILNRIGKAYLYLNKENFEEARENINNAFQIRKSELPSEHYRLADSLSSIGDYHRFKCEFNEALEKYNESLEIYKKSLPLDHPLVAEIHYNIGLLYYSQNDFNESLNHFKTSLEMRENRLPSTHPAIKKTSNYIGLVYKKLNDYKNALIYLNGSYFISIFNYKIYIN